MNNIVKGTILIGSILGARYINKKTNIIGKTKNKVSQTIRRIRKQETEVEQERRKAYTNIDKVYGSMGMSRKERKIMKDIWEKQHIVKASKTEEPITHIEEIKKALDDVIKIKKDAANTGKIIARGNASIN